MDKKIAGILDQTVWITLLALLTITPLIFTTQTSELFEVPKMFFVYFGATVIFFVTCLKFILQGKIELPKNFVFWVFLAFVIVQLISYFLSIDRFTSLFGYPTRLNGGLLSQFAYLVIFTGALLNLNFQKAKKLLVAAVLSGFAVALWGIPSHFGYDPSCLVLTGHLNANCWQIDFNPTLRIFSTMGQPNWLASYLILLLPISTSYALVYKNHKARIYFLFISLILLLAFIFTNSRAGLIGLVVEVAIFIPLLGIKTLKGKKGIAAAAAIGLVLVFIAFGATLSSRIIDLKNILFENSKNAGPTESASIRLIVWQGAVDVFRNYPVLGTGPETFAYSYYLFRPAAHNQTTEWNFFYNKVHNEFLNYAANGGILTIGTYLALLIITLIVLIKKTQEKDEQKSTLAKAVLAGFLGYQASIFFGFSTVITQLIAYSQLALMLAFSNQKNFEINLRFGAKSKVAIATVTFLVAIFAISIPIRLALADHYFANAQKAQTQEDQISALQNAIHIFPAKNPFYWSELAISLGSAARGDSQFADIAATSAQKALKIAPKNTQIIRESARTYLALSSVDEKYANESVLLSSRLITLAPSDPQAYLALAKAQIVASRYSDARKSLGKAINLKNDYTDAIDLLAQLDAKSLK